MGKKIIITAGPTNEKIDEVMQITNMSTGSLGCRIAQAFLCNPGIAETIEKIYYISPKLAYKPVVPDGQAYKLFTIQATTANDLLNTLGCLLRDPDEHIDAVIHSAAVGDYKGRYAARAEDLAQEIADAIAKNPHGGTDTILNVLRNPTCVQDSNDKISSYEPNLMVMLDLTPKVIGSIKKASPDTVLVGFKLLHDVTDEELAKVASRLRIKNDANWIVANDLGRIGDGKHFAMIIGPDGIEETCHNKDDIARAIVHRVIAVTAGKDQA